MQGITIPHAISELSCTRFVTSHWVFLCLSQGFSGRSRAPPTFWALAGG